MSIKALVGLGNTGAEYEKTYHNAGEFCAKILLRLATREGVTLKQYPVSGFMNESGVPVRQWLRLNNLLISDVVVVHDDSDLPIGSFKLVQGGGSAGHRGIESLVAHLGTADFWRLRIGIRDPKEQVRKKAADLVLDRWSGVDEKSFEDLCAQAWLRLKEI